MRHILPSSIIRLAALLQTLALWTTFPANAATPQLVGGFTQINMQDGGYLTGIVQHGSGRLIARTDGGGIYSSDNQANSWTYLSSNMVTSASLTVQSVAVPQTTGSSSNLILQACGVSYLNTDPGRGIWKSTDGGATWTQTLSGVNFSGGDNERIGGESVIFHPTNDSEAWAGSRAQGLYESLDAGSTWTLTTSGLETNIISTVYIHPSYPNQMFVGGDGGLWASTNLGANWTQISSAPLVMRVTRGADGTVYFAGSSNSTQVIQKITSPNWSAVNWTVPSTFTISNLHTAYTKNIGDTGLSLVTVTVLMDGRLVVGDNDDYTRISSNEGTSFSTISFAEAAGHVVPQWANATTTWNPTCLVQDVLHTNNWYGGAGYGPICTTNSGTNWQYIFNGIGEVVTFKIGFHPTDSNRLYIPCMDLGGAIVTDGGLSGNTVSMAHLFFSRDVVQVSQRALACKTNGYNRVIFPGGTELNNAARLYATTNDGTTWYYPAMVGLPTNTSGTVIDDAMDSLDNPDDFLVLVGGNTGTNLGGVYRTINAGNSFTQCNWYPSSTEFLGSTGYRFACLDRDATNLNVRYLFSRAAYPASSGPENGGGFFISYDRGVDWTQLTGYSGGIVAGDWANWQGSVMVADHGISGSLWIAVQNGSQGLAHSVNSGSNWTWVSGFTNGLAVDALNGNVVVYGARTTDAWNKIYYSSNNGANWSLVTATNYAFGNTTALALDPYRPGRIFIGTGERSVGIFTPGTPQQQWQLDYFMSTNSSQCANGSEPGGNGVPNLVAYALGADPLAGMSSDPLGPGSTNSTNYMPYAAISTNPLLAGQPVMRLNLPDPPPSDIELQVLSSTNLVNWSTNATRNGTSAWQWLASGSSLVAPGLDTNGRALFDIGAPDWTNADGQFLELQVLPYP